MKLRRSFLTSPGELRYGVRTVPQTATSRLRLYFLLVSIRALILAGFCFFLDQAAFDSVAFVTFRSVATPFQWGLGLLFVGLTSGLATLKTNALLARIGLITSGMVMMTAGSSFMASAVQNGVGWWGAVAYLTIGIVDLIVASYPGEAK